MSMGGDGSDGAEIVVVRAHDGIIVSDGRGRNGW